MILPRQRQMGCQPFQARSDQLHGGRSVKLQALLGDRRGNQGMSVPVPADPGAEAENRPHRRMDRSAGTESGDLPGIAQPPIRLRDGSRHGAGQTVNDPLSLHVDGRSLCPHLLRPPPALQHRLEVIASFAVGTVFA